MKKLYLFALSCLAAANAIAQPVLKGNVLPSVGFAAEAYTGAPDAEGAAGAGVTWNFSNINVSFAADISVVKPNTTPYFSKYTTSNFAIKIEAGLFDIYNYYRADTGSLQVVATGASTLGGTIDNAANNRLWLKFPFHYQDVATDTFMIDTTAYVDSIIYDGYGTLITPFDTFKNVARTQTFTKDSFGTIVNITYTWFSTDSIFQLLSIDSFQTLLTKYIHKPVAIQGRQLSGSDVRLYPNPAHDAVTLDAGALHGTVVIRDISGRQVAHQLIDGNPVRLSLQSFKAGLYFCTITDEDTGQQYTAKLVVQP